MKSRFILRILYPDDFAGNLPPYANEGTIVLLGDHDPWHTAGEYALHRLRTIDLLDFISLDGTDKSFLRWFSQYSVGGKLAKAWEASEKPLLLADGETKIHRYIPLVYIRSQHKALGQAFELWEYIANEKLDSLRSLFFRYDDDDELLFLKKCGAHAWKCSKEEYYKFENNIDNKTLEYGGRAMGEIIDAAQTFTVTKLSSSIRSKDKVLILERHGKVIDPLNALWEVLVQRLCKRPLTWNYKRCADCGKIVDMSHRGKNWKHCEKCRKKHRREYQKGYQKEYRKTQVTATSKNK